MFTLPSLIALIAVILVRPQEFIPALASIPLLHLLTLATALGLALDLRLGHVRVRSSPLFALALAHFAWSIVTLAAMARHAFARELVVSATAAILFFATAIGVQTFKGIRLVGAALLACTLLITAVALDQAQGPWECHRPQAKGKDVIWVSDGRSCDTREICSETALDSDTEFRCERLGLIGTNTIEGRVKYRGIMEDPNELAAVMAASLSFAFAAAAMRPGAGWVWTLVPLLMIGSCTVFTKSRSGQLAFLTVLGVYLLKRLRWAGVAAAGVIALPVLLLGGRSDAKADASAMHRLEAWMKGFTMWKQSPLFGVGKGQYGDHFWLTAHNSFMLLVGEQGSPGVLIWVATIYFATKTLLTVMRQTVGPAAFVARTYATALLAAMAALMVSAFFLSFAYHPAIWIYLGLVAALLGATRRHDPALVVRATRWDALAIGGITVGLASAIYVYCRLKGV